MRPRVKALLAVAIASGALIVTALAATGSDSAKPVPPVPCPIAERSASSIAGQAGGDTAVGAVPCPGGPIVDPPIATHVHPTPGMTDVHPIPWTSANVGGDDHTIAVAFTTGIAPCYVLDHVGVAYTADTVTITLYQGSAPSSQHVACADIAMFASTTVRLDQPLAGRTIVDGVKH